MGVDWEVATGIGFRLKGEIDPDAAGEQSFGFRIIRYGSVYEENEVFHAAVINDVGLGDVGAALEDLRQSLESEGLEFLDPGTAFIDDYFVGGGFFW